MDAKYDSAAASIGAKIRARREAHGLSQGALAEQVFVSRQTVNNWENAKTLPDIRSLQLMAKTFDCTVDELLDDDAARLVEETAVARHTLLAWLVLSVAYMGAIIIDGAVNYFAHHYLTFADRQGINLFAGAVRALIAGLWVIWALRAEKVRKDYDLRNALDVVAFIEGRRGNQALPDTLLYRVILPHWNVIWVVMWLVFFVSMATVVVLTYI